MDGIPLFSAFHYLFSKLSVDANKMLSFRVDKKWYYMWIMWYHQHILLAGWYEPVWHYNHTWQRQQQTKQNKKTKTKDKTKQNKTKKQHNYGYTKGSYNFTWIKKWAQKGALCYHFYFIWRDENSRVHSKIHINAGKAAIISNTIWIAAFRQQARKGFQTLSSPWDPWTNFNFFPISWRLFFITNGTLSDQVEFNQ